MGFLDPSITFDPAGPFYHLVVVYAAQVHGLLDLTSRAIRRACEGEIAERVRQGVPRDTAVAAVCEGVLESHRDQVRALLECSGVAYAGDPYLGSTLDLRAQVLTTRLADELFAQHSDSVDVFNDASAGSLLIAGWALTDHAHTSDPLWEFLRHCRNAAAHGGRLNLLDGEPSSPARWRTLEVLPVLEGKPLFPDGHGGGFIGPGDVLYLLSDIERKFF